MYWGHFIFWWNVFLVKGVWSEETEVLVEEGSQAVLPCHTNLLSPAVAQVRWSKSNDTVWRKERSGLEYYGISWAKRGPMRVTHTRHQRMWSPHTGFSTGDYSLYMTNVTEKDGGLYTCRAEGEGLLVHKRVTLRVIKGIVLPTRAHTRVYAAVGSAVTLPCMFSHGSTPSDPVWEKTSGGSNPLLFQLPSSLPPSSSSLSPSRSPSQSPWDVSASIGVVAPGDQGTYRCSGMIEGRRLSRSLQLVLSHVESNRGDPEILTCQLSDDSEVTQYDWVFISQDAHGTQIVTSKQHGNISRIRLTENILGEWVCRFYGEKGMLGNATYHTETMRGLHGHSDTELSSNTSTVLVVSGVAVLVVLILAWMCRKYQMKKRIVQYPALEAIVHAMANKHGEQ